MMMMMILTMIDWAFKIENGTVEEDIAGNHDVFVKLQACDACVCVCVCESMRLLRIHVIHSV